MDRELRRKPDDCPDDTVLPAVTHTGQREPLKCDPPAPAPPDVFVTPVAAPASTTLPSYVVPVVPVPNAAQTARCSDRADGSTSNQGPGATDAVTTAAATFTQDVALQDIPGLTESQGRFLAGLVDVLVLLTYTEAQLVSLARLLPSQATWLHAQRTGALTVANAQALALANTLLDCYWNNEQVIVSCADATGQPAQLGISNPVTVNAGLSGARSRVSQADANDLAGVIGRAQLVCVWVNAAVTVTCGDQGFDTSPPVPGTLIVNIGDTPAPADAQLGSVTVQAGAVESAVGQAEADDAALELASSLLNCFFTNALVSLSCVDLGKVDTAEGSNTSGNPIVVPAGEVVSFVSLADANAQADALARSALNCFWVNVEKIATCPDQTVGVPPAPVVTYPASLDSPLHTATIPAGLISSEISQVDANDQADIAALGQLDCLYCNTEVPAQCVPPGTTTPVDIGSLHPDWSRDVTTGVAAGVYCADNAATAQTLAESLGVIPIRSMVKTSSIAECTWGNDLVKAKCVSDEGADIVGKWEPGERPDLDLLSPPSLSSIVYFAKDSVILTYSAIAAALGTSPSPTESQAYVNSQAEIQAKSFLNCYWESDAFEARCTAALLTGIAGLNAIYGTFIMPDGTSTADGVSVRSVSAPANLFMSFTGKIDAQNMALSAAISQLSCWVKNKNVEARCTAVLADVTPAGGVYGSFIMPDGTSDADGASTRSFTISANTITSYIGDLDANTQAMLIALSQLDCWVKNKRVEARCTAVLADVTPAGGIYGEFTMPDGTSDADGASARSFVISADTITSYTGDLDANTQAMLIALSKLDCWVKNKYVEARCTATLNMVTPAGGVYGDFSMPVDGSANAASMRSVPIAADIITSYIGDLDANTQAMIVAISQLDCWVKNTRQCAECPEPGPVLICTEAGKLTSYQGQQDVDDLAKLLAQTATSCIYENEEQTAEAEEGCQPGRVPAGALTAPSLAEANSTAMSLAIALTICVDDLGAGDGVGGSGGGTDLDCGCYFSATLAVDSARYLEMTAGELLDVANRTTTIVTVRKRGLFRVVTQTELDNMKPAPANPEVVGRGLYKISYEKSQSYPLQFSYLLGGDDRSFSSWTETICGDQYIIEKGVAAPDEKWLPDYTYKIYDRGEGFPVPCGAEVGYAPHGGQFTQAYQLRVNKSKELYLVFNGMPKKVVMSFGAPQDI